MIQPFNGVGNIMMCAAVAEFFLKQGNNAYVLVHRDSDCLLLDEIGWYLAREESKLPGRCKLFFTPLTDVEHQFCRPSHIAEALNLTITDATALIEGLIDANAAMLAMEFANKRGELKSKILRDMKNVPSATDLAKQRLSFEQVRGKRLWGLLNQALIARQLNPMHLLNRRTNALKIASLAEFAAMAWPQQDQASSPDEAQRNPGYLVAS